MEEKKFKLSPELAEEVDELEEKKDALELKIKKAILGVEELHLEREKIRKELWSKVYSAFPDLEDERCSYIGRGVIHVMDKDVLGKLDGLNDMFKHMFGKED